MSTPPDPAAKRAAVDALAAVAADPPLAQLAQRQDVLDELTNSLKDAECADAAIAALDPLAANAPALLSPSLLTRAAAAAPSPSVARRALSLLGRAAQADDGFCRRLHDSDALTDVIRLFSAKDPLLAVCALQTLFFAASLPPLASAPALAEAARAASPLLLHTALKGASLSLLVALASVSAAAAAALASDPPLPSALMALLDDPPTATDALILLRSLAPLDNFTPSPELCLRVTSICGTAEGGLLFEASVEAVAALVVRGVVADLPPPRNPSAWGGGDFAAVAALILALSSLPPTAASLWLAAFATRAADAVRADSGLALAAIAAAAPICPPPPLRVSDFDSLVPKRRRQK
jgi:hypothetical protein